MKYSDLPLIAGLGLLASFAVSAMPDEQLIDQYNQVATGQSGNIDTLIHQFNDQIDRDGADALSLIYLGSAQTLEAREAWLPWNKMKYAEKGIATIAKGLSLLEHESTPVADQPLRQGIPSSFLAKAIAAATYTSLPAMFNQFDKGYDLYLQLLQVPAFQQITLQRSGWIYRKAIDAAIHNQDKKQATAWLEQMQQIQPDAGVVHNIRALIQQTEWK